ncbi:MAG: ribosome-binding factor A [Flammeovirgaceae bacterium]|nr:ribosome-binding factor A [Flammeovirgaceae bacterium]PDH49546.1 MAG: ribosome-binding factor A [Rhodothermaeota bacterium MED-G16]
MTNNLKRQRIEKHESLIHGVVNEYILKEGKSFLKNEFVTVMGIKLSPDLSVALIFISVLDNSKSDFVNERFQERKHDIKQYIVKAIAKKIRKIPEIKFIIDSTEHEASRVNKIISNLDIPPTK